MGDDDFLRASRSDFKTLLDAGAESIPVPPEYRDAVADALVGLQTHAILVRDTLNAVSVGAP
jgi:hypothetical protein